MNQVVVDFSTRFHFKVIQSSDFLLFDEIIEFVMQSRKKLFPMLDHQQLPEDLKNFERHFIADDLGCFIALYDAQRLIGVVGFKRYDHRFTQFSISKNRTVEIVKLFIDESYRRVGLASLLIYYLKNIAMQREIEALYLHTHPFLVGAKSFWLQHGFQLLDQEEDGIWNTIHMSFQFN